MKTVSLVMLLAVATPAFAATPAPPAPATTPTPPAAPMQDAKKAVPNTSFQINDPLGIYDPLGRPLPDKPAPKNGAGPGIG